MVAEGLHHPPLRVASCSSSYSGEWSELLKKIGDDDFHRERENFPDSNCEIRKDEQWRWMADPAHFLVVDYDADDGHVSLLRQLLQRKMKNWRGKVLSSAA